MAGRVDGGRESIEPTGCDFSAVGPHVDEWEVMREEMDDGFDDVAHSQGARRSWGRGRAAAGAALAARRILNRSTFVRHCTKRSPGVGRRANDACVCATGLLGGNQLLNDHVTVHGRSDLLAC